MIAAVVLSIIVLIIIVKSLNKPSFSIYVGIEPHKYSKEEQEDIDKEEYDRWLKRANPVLDSFSREFKKLTSDNSDCYRSTEEVVSSRDKCVDLWYAYLSTQDGIHVWVHAKDYMRNYLGSVYEPCMETSDALKKRLNSAAEFKKLSQQKRDDICMDILTIVSECGSVMRCKLLKKNICDSTYEQIESCYQYLLLKKQLYEYKSGSRYYVTSDVKQIK